MCAVWAVIYGECNMFSCCANVGNMSISVLSLRLCFILMFLFGLQAVDYESRSSYSFSVEVLNPIVDPRFLRRGPFKDRALIRVAVLDADEPPRFSRARYRMDVSENCPPACTVGRVSAVDPDTGLTNNIRYRLHTSTTLNVVFVVFL